MPDEVDDTGIVYLSRFYALRDGCEFPPRTGLIGGDLGYLKYGVFLGDNRTFSITLATPSDDDELRKILLRPGRVRRGRPSARSSPRRSLDGRAEPIEADASGST